MGFMCFNRLLGIVCDVQEQHPSGVWKQTDTIIMYISQLLKYTYYYV